MAIVTWPTDTPYLAWEFIEGQPLSVQLKAGPLLESEVLSIGRDVSAAIAEIWSQRIVHGDIKPSNIMLRNCDGYIMVGSVASAVLIDLGAARYLDQENIRILRHSKYRYPIDTAAAVKPIGTWGYSSPEQISGVKPLSCASDVFSLGVVLLQCLLGRHPTGYDQIALADGIQATEGRLAASVGLLRRAGQDAVGTSDVEAKSGRTQPPFPRPMASEPSGVSTQNRLQELDALQLSFTEVVEGLEVSVRHPNRRLFVLPDCNLQHQ
jgi:serine/threonine protein kinase